MEKFTLKLACGEFENCWFECGKYNEPKNLYLAVHNKDGVMCVCTINDGEYNGDDCITVKDYSENEGMTRFLMDKGIINYNDVRKIKFSGYVCLQTFGLTAKGKMLFK